MDYSSDNHIATWSLTEKTVFRFLFTYFFLFIIFQNNGAFPFFEKLMQKPTEWVQKFIVWLGNSILKLPEEIKTTPSGSGDTTLDYILVLCILAFSLFSTIIWTVLDRNKSNYANLYYWLTLALRFYLGLMLINYGLFKIIKMQFPFPGLSRLISSYGESSPMGLAWTFLGFSKGYNLFMGIAEVLSILLLFRRTMTAGAIITLMTAANVMAVNYFYDVPVKILSTHLVLMTLFLLSRDMKALFEFFFTSKEVRLTTINQPIFKTKWIKTSFKILKIIILGYVLVYGFINVFDYSKQYGDLAKKPSHYGLYEITLFRKNKDTVVNTMDNDELWKYIILEYEGTAQIQKADKSKSYYKTTVDSLKNELKLTSYRDSTDTFKLNIKKTDSTFTLETVIKNDSIKASGNILKKEDFLLMNRGFRWINEYPFNR